MRSVSTSHIHTEAEAMADMMQLKTKRMNEKSRLLSFKHTTCTRKHSHGYQQRTGHLRIITHTLQWANPQPHSEFKSKWQLSTQKLQLLWRPHEVGYKSKSIPMPDFKRLLQKPAWPPNNCECEWKRLLPPSQNTEFPWIATTSNWELWINSSGALMRALTAFSLIYYSKSSTVEGLCWLKNTSKLYPCC